MAKQANRAPTGQIRIIGGQWRGRRLPVLSGDGLRPTTDRVKETLFNWLMHDVRDARCLDLFAGSGGLGFESLSRHAQYTLLIEKAKPVALQLEKNLATLKATSGEVKCADALTLLAQKPPQPFDIIFIDPPFRQGLLHDLFALIETNGWLAKDGMVYLETEQELVLPPLPQAWRLYREKTAGQVAYRLFQNQDEGSV
ncbi:16S rRNA (guanine(966)-N(2))-methyltransferase RsmD [Corallincola holothuriorum]|uniref:Ribosomal RNA small subunit methyltransferase D n=1 Tax=Corallincola holothuriorum TaxID=2282215 RepID=A0A368NM47_9GAMM|nr:16S rRNA (guanine(966)-N(2))-methyltransferase RsmD [Corallincola holothuriorum]RCU50973.1 16S rRNA (guanine(966)-N(2))-methyltransferase RsmD [Corallincola holothuriorum]